MQLGLRSGGNHHGVVDALAIDGLAGIEESRPVCKVGLVGFAVLDGAVGVVGETFEIRDAVGEPEAAHACPVKDPVVRIRMRVRLPEAGKDCRIGGFDRARDACGWRGGVRLDAGDAIVGNEDVDILQLVRSMARPEARGVDQDPLRGLVARIRKWNVDGLRKLCGAIVELE